MAIREQILLSFVGKERASRPEMVQELAFHAYPSWLHLHQISVSLNVLQSGKSSPSHALIACASYYFRLLTRFHF